MDRQTVGLTITVLMLIVAAPAAAATLAMFFNDRRRKKARADAANFSEIRNFSREYRYALNQVAFGFYKNGEHVDQRPDFLRDIPVLSCNEWLPGQLSDIDAGVKLDPLSINSRFVWSPTIKECSRYLWPTHEGGQFASYSDTVANLDKPLLWDNRPVFCVTGIGRGTKGQCYHVSMQWGKYFDHVDTEEAVAFEMARYIWMDKKLLSQFQGSAASIDASLLGLPFRRALGSPLAFGNRCAALGINTLTLVDRSEGDQDPKLYFYVHLRNPNQTASAAASWLSVIPAGEFQPSGMFEDAGNDYDIWRNIMREYVEELLNVPEAKDQHELDYGSGALGQLSKLRQELKMKVFLLGFAIEPLNLKPQILTACVF